VPLRRRHAKDGSESPAGVWRLSDILLPDFTLHIFAYTANVLTGEWSIPSRLREEGLAAHNSSGRKPVLVLLTSRISAS
jgi:hypothetical protein